MICVYVGKGYVNQRVKFHIANKWPTDETLYLSFFECNNRISKYLEQLFLDTYKFHLNKDENTGTDRLYGLWDNHRFEEGTETQRLGDILVPKLFNEN